MSDDERKSLVAAAEAAAADIEKAAAEEGVTYHAAQSFYGVGVEALVGERWVKVRDLADGAAVEAVRLFDCDGVRGEACRTTAAVEDERLCWRNSLS